MNMHSLGVVCYLLDSTCTVNLCTTFEVRITHSAEREVPKM